MVGNSPPPFSDGQHTAKDIVPEDIAMEERREGVSTRQVDQRPTGKVVQFLELMGEGSVGREEKIGDGEQAEE